MSINQLHGKRFEDVIKATTQFAGASDNARSNTAGFDIEAKFDKLKSLPTSIKVTGNKTIALSDARRFWTLACDYRMLVGRWYQEDGIKAFREITEFIISTEAHKAMLGTLPLKEVDKFHHDLASFRHGYEGAKEARMFHSNRKSQLEKDFSSYITLNPKVDSKSQRRLQCSVSFDALSKFADEKTVFTESYSDIVLPFQIISSPRSFS
ncbi:hypothetical protein ACJ3XI_01700 [Litorimonas sp. RW-G-Af-16]|uniref:hypothetical protein n=1 Tax=Litorimonas sp. RW-G-Af-16 TaxID=3241168 RepID=UPI00390CB65A